MNALRRLLLTASCLLFSPPAALADKETCEEVAETCLENCHVDYGMEKMREELTKCIESCQRRRDDCADGRQEQKRGQFRLDQEAGSATRRDPVDVYHYDDSKDLSNVTQEKPEPYEDFDQKLKDEREAAKRPPPKKKGEDELALEKRQQEKAERARKNDPDADSGPVKKQDAERKKKKDLSGDDWAKE